MKKEFSNKTALPIAKVNYHFTNRCNYFCQHCFVDKTKPEIPLSQKFLVIDHIKEYFEELHCKGTINLVGGEPTLSPDFGPLLSHATKQGLNVGTVTNGSALTPEFFARYGSLLSEIGLSIDSLNPALNRLFGRCDIQGKVNTREHWYRVAEQIHLHGIRLKINICLAQMNCNDDFTNFLEKVKPDRLKVMVLSIVAGVNDKLADQKPTQEQVEAFVARHKAFNPVVENDGEMQNAYVMVNSRGMLCINDQGIEKELKNLVENRLVSEDLSLIDPHKYFKRYNKT